MSVDKVQKASIGYLLQWCSRQEREVYVLLNYAELGQRDFGSNNARKTCAEDWRNGEACDQENIHPLICVNSPSVFFQYAALAVCSYLGLSPSSLLSIISFL